MASQITSLRLLFKKIARRSAGGESALHAKLSFMTARQSLHSLVWKKRRFHKTLVFMEVGEICLYLFLQGTQKLAGCLQFVFKTEELWCLPSQAMYQYRYNLPFSTVFVLKNKSCTSLQSSAHSAEERSSVFI